MHTCSVGASYHLDCVSSAINMWPSNILFGLFTLAKQILWKFADFSVFSLSLKEK